MKYLIITVILSILLAIPSFGSGLTTSGHRDKIVFIAGYDESDNTYYTNARSYFKSKGYKVVDGQHSLDEIIQWLNTYTDYQSKWSELHIVSHGNPWRGLSIKTHDNGDRVDVQTLASAIDAGQVAIPEDVLVCAPKVILHSCGVGSNKPLMKMISEIFASDDQLEMYSTPYYNLFGGAENDHTLAAVHYGFYKTAYYPGRLKLAKQLEDRYDHTDIDWNEALKKEVPESPGDPFQYKFNVPVEWTFDFESSEEVPELKGEYAILDYVIQQDELMDELEAMDIDLEYFRWRVVKKDKSLIIKAKVTVVCILSTIMEDEDRTEAKAVSIADSELYIKVLSTD